MAAEKADVIIDAGLLRARTNEAEANTLYLGKILIVTISIEQPGNINEYRFISKAVMLLQVSLQF
jgi:hypothetical protein